MWRHSKSLGEPGQVESNLIFVCLFVYTCFKLIPLVVIWVQLRCSAIVGKNSRECFSWCQASKTFFSGCSFGVRFREPHANSKEAELNSDALNFTCALLTFLGSQSNHLLNGPISQCSWVQRFILSLQDDWCFMSHSGWALAVLQALLLIYINCT